MQQTKYCPKKPFCRVHQRSLLAISRYRLVPLEHMAFRNSTSMSGTSSLSSSSEKMVLFSIKPTPFYETLGLTIRFANILEGLNDQNFATLVFQMMVDVFTDLKIHVSKWLHSLAVCCMFLSGDKTLNLEKVVGHTIDDFVWTTPCDL